MSKVKVKYPGKSHVNTSYFRESVATITEACIIVLFHNKPVTDFCYHSHTTKFNWLPSAARRIMSAKVVHYLL